MPHFDHFDFLAPLYEVVIPPKDPVDLEEYAQLPTSGALLDAGGGTGRVSKHLVGKADQIIIADISCGMASRAAEKDGIAPVCAPSEMLPFPKETFSRVIMVDALHHVFHQEQTINELWRVLQPNGLLVIEEPDVRAFGVKLIRLMEKVLLMRSHFLKPDRVAELCAFPDAEVRIETKGTTAYIIARKLTV